MYVQGSIKIMNFAGHLRTLVRRKHNNALILLHVWAASQSQRAQMAMLNFALGCMSYSLQCKIKPYSVLGSVQKYFGWGLAQLANVNF